MSDDVPMKDVVRMVLDAEQESKVILERAQAEADERLAEARRRAQRIAQRVRRETAEKAALMVEAAEQESEIEKQRLLENAEAELKATVLLDKATFETVVDAVIRAICQAR